MANPLIDQVIEDLGEVWGEGHGWNGHQDRGGQAGHLLGDAVVIASGQEPRVILRLVEGEALGTFFSPVTTRLEGRKRWMLSLPVKGRIAIDAGAKTALQRQGSSGSDSRGVMWWRLSIRRISA